MAAAAVGGVGPSSLETFLPTVGSRIPQSVMRISNEILTLFVGQLHAITMEGGKTNCISVNTSSICNWHCPGHQRRKKKLQLTRKLRKQLSY